MLGALTSVGQSHFTGGWAALTNSASTWVMVALVAGRRVPGRPVPAAVAGLLSQAGLVLGYYATSGLRGFPVDRASLVVWIAAGALAGPAYGAAGALLRDPRTLLRATATGLTGSVRLLEGLHFLQLDTAAGSYSGPGPTAGWCYLAVGCLLPPLLARSARDRLLAVLPLLAGAMATAGAVLLVEASFLNW